MTPIIKYRILIVDDNPFPTRECCGILLEKMQNHFGKTFDHTLQEYYCNNYNALQTEYHNIAGKSFHFLMDADVSVSIYNYNPTDTKENNQTKILEIIKDKEINIFWTDRGHTNFRINGAEMFEETNGHPAKADEIYSNKNIVQQLKTNGIRQVAMYSYNPKFTYTAIDNKVEEIGKIFQGKLSKDDIYVLETSPILNLFSPEDKLYNGLPDTELLGTLNAYKYYGKLLGSVLFDLFLQIKESKAKLSAKQKRYNFFNRYNRNFLRYFKLLNSDLINKFNDFKIGMVSFYGNIYGQEHFLIDVPYKEYYEKYDTELHKGYPPIGTIIDPIDTDDTLDSKKWLHFKYKKDGNGQFTGCYELEDSIKSRGHLVEYYLPLLHTAIFYEPDFYANDFPYKDFKITTKDEFCLETGNSCIEIIYLFKKVSFEGIQGVSHFVVWRRVQPESESIDLKETIKEIWENYYRLVEPKLEAALVTILQSETAKQAIRAAISQVMARNMSHNIGSHVMNKLIGDLRSLELLNFEKDKTSYKSSRLTELHSKLEEKLNKDDWYNKADPKLKSLALKNEIALKLISDFNSYVKCRMDYLADLTFGTPAMLSSKNVYTDIFEDLDKVRLLLDNISGRGQQFQYKLQFKFKDNLLNKETDFPVAIPNDVLGCQAFYNIIENVIRNTAKHATNASIPIKEFTVNFREIGEEEIDGNIDLWHEVQSLYCVEIYDNLPIDNIEALVKSQNLKIDGKILDEENTLRGESLGMIEMDASAAYLRQLEIVEVDSDDYDVDEDDKIYNSKGKLNILKAFNKNGCLAYRFFIKKPQDVLIVTDKNYTNKELIKNGIWQTDVESFKQDLEQNRNYNHNFLVLEEGNAELKNLLAEREAAVTRRVFYKTSDEIQELLQKTPEEIKLILWRWREEKLYSNYENLGKRLNGKNEIIGLPKFNGKEADFANHLYEIADAQNPLEKWKEKCKNHFYYEALSSKAQSILPYYDLITKEVSDDNLKIPKYLDILNDPYENYTEIRVRIAESILSRIIVLDERIQDKLNDKLYKIRYSEHFKMSGIFVPNKDFDLKADAIEIKRIVDFVDETMKENNYGSPMYSEMDYMLIHYSLLERAYENEKEKNKVIEFQKKDWVHNKLKDFSKKINIVVTSGRGNIQGLPNNVRYVNLSVVTTALIEIKSKYLIHNILHSSRTN